MTDMESKHLAAPQEQYLCEYLLAEKYHNRHPRDIQIDSDGSVTLWVDPMPGTNEPGRIFAGYAQDLHREAIYEDM